LVPDELVVETVELETADPALRGEMTISLVLADAPGGTELVALHERLAEERDAEHACCPSGPHTACHRLAAAHARTVPARARRASVRG
jgi:hypothetical protein